MTTRLQKAIDELNDAVDAFTKGGAGSGNFGHGGREGERGGSAGAGGGKPVGGESRVKPWADRSPQEKWKSIESSDYQNRGPDAPRSGRPDAISVYGTSALLEFKDTPEEEAKAWTKHKIDLEHLPYTSITTAQKGDYPNDWVHVYVDFSGG